MAFHDPSSNALLLMSFLYSYCNSIIQCLYYSPPFREQVINFPRRSPPESLQQPMSAHALGIIDTASQFSHVLSPLKSKNTPGTGVNVQKGKPVPIQGPAGQQ